MELVVEVPELVRHHDPLLAVRELVDEGVGDVDGRLLAPHADRGVGAAGLMADGHLVDGQGDFADAGQYEAFVPEEVDGIEAGKERVVDVLEECRPEQEERHAPDGDEVEPPLERLDHREQDGDGRQPEDHGAAQPLVEPVRGALATDAVAPIQPALAEELDRQEGEPHDDAHDDQERQVPEPIRNPGWAGPGQQRRRGAGKREAGEDCEKEQELCHGQKEPGPPVFAALLFF